MHPMKTNSPAETESKKTSTKTEKSGIMKDVVAFVDLDDKKLSKNSLTEKIEAMGGKVVKQAKAKTITHYVFLTGKDSTISAAREAEKPLVSPKWIIECEEQNKLLDCKNEKFAAVTPKKEVKEIAAKKRSVSCHCLWNIIWAIIHLNLII